MPKRAAHLCQFAGKLLCFLLGRCALPGFQFPDLCLPAFLHIVVHPHTGDLIQADEHRLAAGPKVRVMLHKILCNGAQPFICGENMDLLGKFSFQLFLLRGVEVDCFNGIQDPPGDLRVLTVYGRTVCMVRSWAYGKMSIMIPFLPKALLIPNLKGTLLMCNG